MAFSETAPLIAALKLDDKFSGPLKNAGKALGTFDAKLDHTQTRAFRAGQQIGTGIKNTARLAVAGIGILASQVALGLNSLIKLEDQTAQTEAVLKSTGGAAGVAAGEVRKLAEQYESLNATIGDETIQNAENLLLTFTNVRKQAFEPALKAALDMNQAFGGGESGLAGTMRLVGKALQDPEKGLSRLGRAVGGFSDETTKAVKEAIKQNDVLKAQNIILAELEKRYGGSFARAGDTVRGKVAKFTDSIEDLQRALAEALLPTLGNVADALTKTLADPSVVQGVKDFGKGLAGIISPANLASAAGVLKDVFNSAREAAPVVLAAAKAMGSIVGAAVSVFKSLPPEIQKLAVGAFAINKLTGGLVTNIAGGLIGGVLKQLVSGVVNVRGASVIVTGGIGGGVGAAGGVAPAASKLSKIASIATKVFIVGAAIGVFAEFKGMLDEQSANNRATQVDQKATLKDFIAQGNRKELQKSLDDLVKIDRDLTNSLTPEAIAYQLDIDGVRDSVHADMDALRAAIAKLPQADKESRDKAAVVKLSPDDRGDATAAAIENSLRPGVLARALAAGFHPSAAAIQRTLDNNAAHLEESIYVATVGKREDRQDTKDRGNAPDAPRNAALAAVTARAIAAGFKPTADQIQRTLENNIANLEEIQFAATAGMQDVISAVKEQTPKNAAEDAIRARAVAKSGKAPTEQAVQNTLARNIERAAIATKAAATKAAESAGASRDAIIAARQNPIVVPAPNTNVKVTVNVTAAQVSKSVVIQKRFGPPGGSRESDAGHYGGAGT